MTKKAARASATTSTGFAVKVRATKDGYYGHAYRYAGNTFTVESDTEHPKHKGFPITFSDKWMEEVDPSTPEKTTGSQQEINEAHDATLAQRASANGGAAPSGDDNPLNAD
jgi:hypothetical protein